FRFGIEFVRQPDQHLGFIVGHLSMGQLLCAPMILAGGIVIWRSMQSERPVSKTELASQATDTESPIEGDETSDEA
ncbi:MAG: prolipoprotein diacylglyceryl transferase family protein, partial [Nannocystaceae bacterium]